MDPPGGISLAATAGTFDVSALTAVSMAAVSLFRYGGSTPMPETQSVSQVTPPVLMMPSGWLPPLPLFGGGFCMPRLLPTEEAVFIAEAAEQKRLARKKQLEDERANREPWLNFPEVVEAESKLQELKDARRDANVKLEFGFASQLTKEFSKAEQDLQKKINKAEKDNKKGKTSLTADEKGRRRR